MNSTLAISSPNTDRSLLSIASLRSAAGVEDNSQDEALLALGRYVSATITRACRVEVAGAIPPTLRLETVAQTTVLDQCTSSFRLLRKPVVAIDSVVEDGETLAAGTDYRLDGELLIRRSGGGNSVWKTCADIVATYSAGWSTVPDDLEFAARKFVAEEWRNGDRDRLLKRKKTDGVSEYEWWVDPTKDQVIPADVMTILKDGGYVNNIWAV